MAHRLAALAVGCACLLGACANNQEIAARRCSGLAGPAYDQCVARELDALAKTQVPATSTGGGGY